MRTRLAKGQETELNVQNTCLRTDLETKENNDVPPPVGKGDKHIPKEKEDQQN
jgi:hypothetical protein